MSKRGANQSADTKFATLDVCNAIGLLRSGRAGDALSVLMRAAAMLPDINHEEQALAIRELAAKRAGRGIAA